MRVFGPGGPSLLRHWNGQFQVLDAGPVRNDDRANLHLIFQQLNRNNRVTVVVPALRLKIHKRPLDRTTTAYGLPE